MNVVINEDKNNIDSIMQLVGGTSGTGGVIATLSSIKSDIETSTSSSKRTLDGFTITTQDDPVVLKFKNATSSGGEIYEMYDNIDKSLDSGSYVTLCDLLSQFYGSLKTYKEKLQEKASAEENNRTVNRTIGATGKNYTMLDKYNSDNNTNFSYKNVPDISSYKTNCSNYLSTIQSITFSFNEDDDGDFNVPLVSERSSVMCYSFGWAVMFSEDAYVLSGPCTIIDPNDPDGPGQEVNSQYNQADYQAAIDAHRDIIMNDGDQLSFSWRDHYNSNSCITMYSFDESTGTYRRVSYCDPSDGTKHFEAGDSGKTPKQMRNATYSH